MAASTIRVHVSIPRLGRRVSNRVRSQYRHPKTSASNRGLAMDIWHQIEIRDETALSGPSLVRLIGILADQLPVARVVVSRAEGSGQGFADLFPEMVDLSTEGFAARAAQVSQFDWGDFFLTQGPGALADLPAASRYTDLLPRTLATVRAVD